MSNKKKILIIQKVHEKGMELINNHPNFDALVPMQNSNFSGEAKTMHPLWKQRFL